MFSSIFSSWYVALDLILLVIVSLNVAGFMLSPYDSRRPGRISKSVQLPQSFLLIIFASIVWLNAPSDPVWPKPALYFFVFAGISMGFLGDLFMANVFKQKDHVLFGMAAFGIGHVLYLLAFRELALLLDLADTNHFIVPEIVMCIAGIILWRVLVFKPKGAKTQFVALAYALFLSAMAGYTLGLAVQQTAFIPLSLGAILFVISDTLIAAQLFSQRSFPFIGDVVWVTYIVAQVLIVSVVPLAMMIYPAVYGF